MSNNNGNGSDSQIITLIFWDHMLYSKTFIFSKGGSSKF